MTDLAPSAIAGDTLPTPGYGAALRLLLPHILSPLLAKQLPAWWSPARDHVLAASVELEDMWGAAVARTATKFAAHGFAITDSNDSTRRVQASQELMKRANGGEGWVPFAQKIAQDLLTTDNGVFIRIRRAGEKADSMRTRTKDTVVVDALSGIQRTEPKYVDVQLSNAPGGARIVGLYHLDSLRCTRTGNLAYPVRYSSPHGNEQLLRWDQVLVYADQPSPRADMYGVGRCAASRAYKTIAKIGAMERMVAEALTGTGANKLALLQGLNDQTLRNLIAAGEEDAQAKGALYYLGTILGAIPSDIPITTVEIRLKELITGFTPKEERDNAYLIYANAIGVPVQDIQPLSGQGLGTGTQTVILEEAARGIGFAAFLKWWEQTVSDRVLPATTSMEFMNEHDVRDQKAKAEVQKLRADTRAARISSQEITPAMARQLALDDGDLPKELAGPDATPGGRLTDDEKPTDATEPNAAAQALTTPPPSPPAEQPEQAAKAASDTEALISSEWAAALDWAKAVLDG